MYCKDQIYLIQLFVNELNYDIVIASYIVIFYSPILIIFFMSLEYFII